MDFSWVTFHRLKLAGTARNFADVVASALLSLMPEARASYWLCVAVLEGFIPGDLLRSRSREFRLSLDP
jgi:hypothetical protein